jgi:hypothetical protein
MLLFAGLIVSGLSHPDMPDDSGWAIYDTAAAVDKQRAPLEDDTAVVRVYDTAAAAGVCCCHDAPVGDTVLLAAAGCSVDGTTQVRHQALCDNQLQALAYC